MYSTQTNNRFSRWLMPLMVLATMSVLFINTAQAQWSASGNDIYNNNSGKVGIGTNSPSSRFSIVSNSDGALAFSIMDNESPSTFQSLPSDWGGSITFNMTGGQGDFTFINRWAESPGPSKGFRFYQQTGTGAFSHLMSIQGSTGNVGIGTENPGSKLDVYTNGFNPAANVLGATRLQGSYGGGLVFMDSAAYAGLWMVDGGHSLAFATNGTSSGFGGAWGQMILKDGNLGIGTSNPIYKLQVVGNINANNMALTGTGGARPVLITYNSDYVSGSTGNGVIVGAAAATGNTPAMIYGYKNGNAAYGDLVVPGGNFGIGTLAPQAKLHVEGDVVVNGNIAAKYQDLAEWVPSDKAIQSGYVVTVDPRLPGHVQPSSEAYDTRVAGVVSETPGIVLGESGNGKVKIATVGRVKVKVDATHNPIQIGDLLVTSAKSGLAMKSEPIDVGGIKIHRPGTLLGKALEALDSGTGEIMVLLSLQ